MPILNHPQVCSARKNIADLLTLYDDHYLQVSNPKTAFTRPNSQALKTVSTSEDDRCNTLIAIFNDFLKLIRQSEIIKSLGKKHVFRILNAQSDLIKKIALLINNTSDPDLALSLISSTEGQYLIAYLLLNNNVNMTRTLSSEQKTIIDYLLDNTSNLDTSLAHALQHYFVCDELDTLDACVISLTLTELKSACNLPYQDMLRALKLLLKEDKTAFMDTLPLFLKCHVKVALLHCIYASLASQKLAREELNVILHLISKSSLGFNHRSIPLDFKGRNILSNMISQSCQVATLISCVNLYPMPIGEAYELHQLSRCVMFRYVYLMRDFHFEANTRHELAVLLSMCLESLLTKTLLNTYYTHEEINAVINTVVASHYYYARDNRDYSMTKFHMLILGNLNPLLNIILKAGSVSDVSHFLFLFLNYSSQLESSSPDSKLKELSYLFAFTQLIGFIQEQSDCVDSDLEEVDFLDILNNTMDSWAIMEEEEAPLSHDVLAMIDSATLMERVNGILSKFTQQGHFTSRHHEHHSFILLMHKAFFKAYQYLRATPEQLNKLNAFLSYEQMIDESLKFLSASDNTNTKPNKKPNKKKNLKKNCKKNKPAPEIEAAEDAEYAQHARGISSLPKSCTFFPSNLPTQTSPQVICIDPKCLPSAVMCFIQAMNESSDNHLFMVGGAVADLMLSKPIELTHDYDFVLFNVDLACLETALKSNMFKTLSHLKIQTEVIGKAHPILSVKLTDEHGNVFQIDVSTHEKKHDHHAANMRDYLSESDFKLSEYYMACDRSDVYLIQHSRKPLGPVEAPSTLELSSSNVDFFIDKPMSLFRLVKMSLKYPELPLSENLNHAIARIQEQNPFDEIFKTRGDQGRVSTSFSQLFERFDTYTLLSQFQKFEILEKLTGFCPNEIKILVESNHAFIDHGDTAEKRKARLFYILTAYHLKTHPNEKTLENWPFYSIARHIQPGDKHFYAYLLHKICDIELNTTFYFPELDDVISDMHILEPTVEQEIMETLKQTC